LHGSRFGIVGSGTIGRAVARLGKAFGMIPLFAGRKGTASTPEGFVPWDEMLATSDVISLHCPLTPETRNLIAMGEFRAMAGRPLLPHAAESSTRTIW
jgi:glycerate dehydrogenase